MCISWIKKIFIIILIPTPLYCNTIKIQMPDYSKFESIGINNYDVEISENGVIQNIICNKYDGTKNIWDIEKQKEISVSIESSEFPIVIKAFSSSYYILKNSMVYVAKQNLSNIHERYEFTDKSDEMIEVLCSMNHGDSEKNVYDTYSERIIIQGKRYFSHNEEDKIQNLKMIMRTGLAEVLIPFIVCDENCFFYPEIQYKASSELTENTIIYSASNLKSLDGNPWATNQIEKAEIFIDIPVRSKTLISFYNGFQHVEKNIYMNVIQEQKIFQ